MLTAYSASRTVRRQKPPPDIVSTVTVDKERLSVHTEDGGRKLGLVVTRVRRKARVIFRLEVDYRLTVHEPEFMTRLNDLVEQVHESALTQCWTRNLPVQDHRTAYLDEAGHHLKQGRIEGAVRVLRDAVERFNRDPFILSHYGYVLASTGAAPETGIHICHEALQSLGELVPRGAGYFQPAFYLNLGRAYLSVGNKPEALKAFTSGLESDPRYGELLWEMGKLGRRKKPIIPFLDRNNPVNKYLGLLPGLGIRRTRRKRADSPDSGTASPEPGQHEISPGDSGPI